MSPAAMCSLIVRTPRFERLARLVGRERRAPVASRLRRLRQAAFELALEELDLRAGELIQRLEILVRRDARVGDDQDPVLDVIEGQHGVEQHEAGFVLVAVAARRVRARPRLQERRLEPGDGVVADEADGAAGEARQARHERRSELRHQPRAARRRTVSSRLGRHARRVDRRLALARAQDEERILAEERIARDAARRLRRSRTGTRSRSARRSSETPRPASAGRR